MSIVRAASWCVRRPYTYKQVALISSDFTLFSSQRQCPHSETRRTTKNFAHCKKQRNQGIVLAYSAFLICTMSLGFIDFKKYDFINNSFRCCFVILIVII